MYYKPGKYPRQVLKMLWLLVIVYWKWDLCGVLTVECQTNCCWFVGSRFPVRIFAYEY